MVRGSTRPNIVSQILWALLTAIAFSAQLSAGASWSILILGALMFNMIIIATLAMSGYGYNKYTSLDFACLGLAVAAIILWYLTAEPVLAIVLSVTASVLSAIPTFVKTYRDPHTELALAWGIAVVAAVLSLLSSTKWNIENLIFPTYLLIEALSIWSLAFFGQRVRRSSEVSSGPLPPAGP